MKISGIYQIKNLINNKIYIGSSYDMHTRKIRHFSKLKCHKHDNPILQNAYNKYGKENFRFEILITCDPDLLLFYEQQFIDKWKPEYNIAIEAISPMKGRKHTEETKEKMRFYHIDRKYPEFENSWKHPFYKGRHLPDDVKEKLRKSNTGRKHTIEDKEKQSRNQMGQVRRCKTYTGLISPTGEVFKDITNMRKFCREHGINNRHIWSVLVGKTSQHLGWKLFKEDQNV